MYVYALIALCAGRERVVARGEACLVGEGDCDVYFYISRYLHNILAPHLALPTRHKG